MPGLSLGGLERPCLCRFKDVLAENGVRCVPPSLSRCAAETHDNKGFIRAFDVLSWSRRMRSKSFSIKREDCVVRNNTTSARTTSRSRKVGAHRAHRAT
eukprot:1187220-Prymnesium_polylepis.1